MKTTIKINGRTMTVAEWKHDMINKTEAGVVGITVEELESNWSAPEVP